MPAEEVEEWRLYSTFCCLDCKTSNPDCFDHPFTKACRKCIRKKADKKKRRGDQLPAKCRGCKIRFARDAMTGNSHFCHDCYKRFTDNSVAG